MWRIFVVYILAAITLLAQESGSVIITEIMYNPASSETRAAQFIEIANTTASSISLLNWTIDDEDTDGPNTLPNTTLAPYGIAVICGCTTVDMQGAWGTGFTIISLGDLGQTMFNLANSPSSTNEIIELRDDSNNLIDQVNYDDASPWPSGSSNGKSIYLDLITSSMNATSNNDGGNWSHSISGTNGAFTSSVYGVWNVAEVGSPGNINGDQSLPVSLTSFTATSGNQKVTLRWVTASEVQNAGFDILRSAVEIGNYFVLSSYTTNPDLEGQFSSNTETRYQFIDHLVANGATYWYKLVDVDANGLRSEHGPISAVPQASGADIITENSGAPAAFKFYPAYPNPFNPSTKLKFDTPPTAEGPVEIQIEIYNMLGQKVRALFNGLLEAGVYSVIWDGRTASGDLAPGGVYFANLNSGLYHKTVKMTLLK